MLRHAARFFIVLALLTAQQAALAHQIWHLGKQDSQPAQRQLCEQHHALSTVVGALDCAASDPVVVATAEFAHPSDATPGVTAPRLVPTSRGPPETLS